MMTAEQRAAALRLADMLEVIDPGVTATEAAALLRELASESVVEPSSADIETKNEHYDLYRRSIEHMSRTLDYSARMTVAMETIASVANDWRGGSGGKR